MNVNVNVVNSAFLCMIFAVFDPSPLAMCINSDFTYIFVVK